MAISIDEFCAAATEQLRRAYYHQLGLASVVPHRVPEQDGYAVHIEVPNSTDKAYSGTIKALFVPCKDLDMLPGDDGIRVLWMRLEKVLEAKGFTGVL